MELECLDDPAPAFGFQLALGDVWTERMEHLWWGYDGQNVRVGGAALAPRFRGAAVDNTRSSSQG